MNRAFTISLAIAALFVGGCGADDSAAVADNSTDDSAEAPSVSAKAAAAGPAGKPTVPFRISYDVIGTPVVGSPVTIQLEVHSATGPTSVRFDYRSRDASAVLLGQAQPATVSMELAGDDTAVREQVTVIPQREGRHYINVSASVMTPLGKNSTSIAVPIQVGEGGRELIEHGRLETTESGESVRVLDGN